MALVTKEIDFTPLAGRQLQKITDYILKEFGHNSAGKFVLSVEEALQKIAEGKIVHRNFSKSKYIRYFVLKKKNVFLYRELKDSIVVLGVYNARQDLRFLKGK
jgi:plasmid stabilization system protein ParE